MIQEIKTIEDVKQFAKDLISESCFFHPDYDFNECVDLKTKLKAFTPEEADLRNDLMIQSFAVCEKSGADIYEIMFKEYKFNNFQL